MLLLVYYIMMPEQFFLQLGSVRWQCFRIKERNGAHCTGFLFNTRMGEDLHHCIQVPM